MLCKCCVFLVKAWKLYYDLSYQESLNNRIWKKKLNENEDEENWFFANHGKYIFNFFLDLFSTK